MQKDKTFRLILFTGVLLMVCALLVDLFSPLTIDRIAENASSLIAGKNETGRAFLAQEKPDWDEADRLYSKEKIGLYYFQKDSLIRWNNSRIPIKEKPAVFSDTTGFIKLTHGYYFYRKRATGDSGVILSLLLIKPLYALQNNYLDNHFVSWTQIPKGVVLSGAGGVPAEVKLGDRLLFSISGNDTYYYNTETDTACHLIFLTGFCLLLAALLKLIRSDISPLRFSLAVTFVILLRAIMLFFKWPAFFYRTTLYDVTIFGNASASLNAYLGDMLLNAFLMLFLVCAFTFYFSQHRSSAIFRKGEWVLHCLLLFILLNAYHHSVKSLVTNSTLNFDFLSILNIRLPVFAGLAVLSLYSLTVFICLYRLITLTQGGFLPAMLKVLGAVFLICYLQLLTGEVVNEYFECFWPLIFVLSLYLLLRTVKVSLSLILGVQILIMSLVTSRSLNIYIEKNAREELELLSYKLSERQDPIVESEFNLLPSKITADRNLKNLLTILPASAEGITSLLKQRFFSGYFDRYNLSLLLFDEDCSPLLPSTEGLLNNMGYFDDQIALHADSTSVPGLYFIRDYHKNTRYIARVRLDRYTLYSFMEAKQFEELGSFPDLLLDRSQQKHERLRSFSHAVYRSKQLTSHYGDLNYPVFLQDSATLAVSHPQFINHYYYPEENAVIVISEKTKKWSYFFTVNSYLLLFFSLITYACYLVYASIFTAHFSTPSLTRRIQTIIIVLLLVAMSAIGYTSGSLVTGQFESDNKRLLEEKTQVIINELTGQFSQEQFFDESRKELINLKLKEYARLFNTPISLFDAQGHLFNTSESKLYDLGLSASLVNPKAYRNLKNNYSSAESVVEKAGSLTYLSFYTPVFNNNKQLLGFVNLPYFAKQSALVNELSGIISALINVYVLLFVISIIAGLILAGYITQPLRLIKQQIANISLGRQNEKINWQSNDEIGRLVAEYNQMLVKLENSANLLAQSERESAWREMAKQVAHEIKNPLTPMKLNLQYLQHVMKNEPADFKEKFEKSSLAIIEQIDALATIATEFSNFAKLPVASLQAINLTEIISASVLIYDTAKEVRIMNSVTSPHLTVRGDREQCLRVFNNILKNAVQALEDVSDPVIEIGCTVDEDSVTIFVKDNGCGIDAALKDRLFTPNFTTKTTGSGLGLAMVNNIMEGFGGKIWFESEKGTGSVFYLKFVLSA